MAITITWNDGVNPPTDFTLTDDAAAALEQFRLALTVFGGTTPKYAGIDDMCRAFLVETLITPALTNFPPASVVAAKTALATAQSDYQAALQAAITSSVSGGV